MEGPIMKKWVSLKCPSNMEEMVNKWVALNEENIGWCFLCDRPIRSMSDLIPRTNTHNCERGQQIETKAH